jgi:hypothetical protein
VVARIRDTAGNYVDPVSSDELAAAVAAAIGDVDDLDLLAAVQASVTAALEGVATDEELEAAVSTAVTQVLAAVATDEELTTALSTAVAQVLEQAATDSELRAAIEAALETIQPGDTFVTNIATTEEFVTQLITEEFVTQLITENFITQLVTNEFVTEVVNNATYVTNVTNVINARKGAANELATLGANSQHTPAQIPPGSFSVIIDGGDSAITTGIKADLEIPFACNLIGWTLLADAAGSIVIDVWRDSYANFPPTAADSISTSKPTLSSAAKAQDDTITDWTEAIPAGSILRFNVDSAVTVKRVTLTLKFQRT